MERIAEYEQLTGADLNAVKVVLADEATRLLHGDECLAGIHQTVQALFEQSSGDQAGNLESLPQVQLTVEEFAQEHVSVADLLIKGGFAASKNAARRLISLGGARVNDVQVKEEGAVVSAVDFDAQGRLKLSGSKKKHVVILRPA